MDNLQPRIQRAELLLEQGRPRDAEKQLKEALQQDPSNHFVLALMAKCKIELKHFDEADELIRLAISNDPEEDYYYYLNAFIKYQQDKNEEAISLLNQACSLNPYVASYFGLWAILLLEERMFDYALQKADEGLAIDAEDITCLNARATALTKMKRKEEAGITMEQALQQDPENEFTHTTVGWNHLERGRHQEAVTHFKMALRLSPNFESAKIGLKQALKAKIAPYRWLLQYNFWVASKSQKMRWIFPIAVFIGVKLVSAATKAAGANWQFLGVIIVVAYLLLVATSWIIDPLANFFLLFHKDGKYALDVSEKWNARLFVGSILTGVLVLALSSLIPYSNPGETPVFTAGIIFLALAIPLGHISLPFRTKGAGFLQWYTLALITLGLLTAVYCITGLEGHVALTILFMLGFIAFMWIHSLSKNK